MKSTSAIFAEGAIGLLRRALADGLHINITVNATEARAVLTDARGTELARETRGGQLALPLAPAAVPAPVEAPAPAVDPMAPGHRVMRVGDAVFEARSDGSVTWVVERIDEERGLVHMSNMPLYAQTVARADIRLDAADLWRLASPWDRPEVGDRIELDGRAVEVLSTSRDGFVWREVDPDAVALEEGEAKWADVMPFAPGVWVTRDPEADEAPVACDAAVAKGWPKKGITAPGHWGSRDGLAWERVKDGELIVSPDHFCAGYIVSTPTEARRAMKESRPRAPKKARVSKSSYLTEPAAPVPHRLQAVTEADELARHGEHSLIGLIGRGWRALATRESGETAPTWQARCTLASKTVRVRVYDRATRCTWDSLDGNAEGYIHGGA